MRTPICDFVRQYVDSDTLRLHMPGHKGVGKYSESLDITEIKDADSLYEADGIIKESEENASRLFGCRTYYSTEGSSHCIRAMLYLISLYAKEKGRNAKILAGRNAHKAFLSGAALVDLDVEWIFPSEEESYLSCNVSPSELETRFSEMDELPIALYITSPDYLGNVSDIQSLSKVCRKYGVLLLVDNAHGAYLKFLPKSEHPMDLCADICCDSAHKTLPVLTGGAYLHLSDELPSLFADNVKNALALFGSTSPSYLILQSLDAVNPMLEKDLPKAISELLPMIGETRQRLCEGGYVFCGDEKMKLTVNAKEYGYKGIQIAEYLRDHGIECEFADEDFTVLMPTPATGKEGLKRLERVLIGLPKKTPITEHPPVIAPPKRVCSIREATMSLSESISVKDAVGRVLAEASVACPPAVPIVVCGERIEADAVRCFEYYGINTCKVVK